MEGNCASIHFLPSRVPDRIQKGLQCKQDEERHSHESPTAVSAANKAIWARSLVLSFLAIPVLLLHTELLLPTYEIASSDKPPRNEVGICHCEQHSSQVQPLTSRIINEEPLIVNLLFIWLTIKGSGNLSYP